MFTSKISGVSWFHVGQMIPEIPQIIPVGWSCAAILSTIDVSSRLGEIPSGKNAAPKPNCCDDLLDVVKSHFIRTSSKGKTDLAPQPKAN